MKKYYLHDGNRQSGPFSYEELKLQRISKETPVWAEGMSDWKPAENVPEILDLISVPPPLRHNSAVPPAITANNTISSAGTIHSKRIPIILAVIIAAILLTWLVARNPAQGGEPISNSQQRILIDSEAKGSGALEDERKRREIELTRKNMNYRNNWSRYITVTNGSYRASDLGGIYGLTIVVVNNTDYLLDEVQADVTYVKADGDVWKTIQIPITNVPADSKKITPVEDVERSTSVNVSANEIISKKMHFYFSNEYNSGNPEDPYFMR